MAELVNDPEFVTCQLIGFRAIAVENIDSVEPHADKPMDNAQVANAGPVHTFAHDLSEPLQNSAALERMLLDSDRAALAGRAAVAMVHDFNNILNTIGCIADVLLFEQPPDSQIHSDMAEIKKATVRGAALTLQLLNFGHHTPGTIEAVDLSELVATCCTIIGRTLGARSHLQIEIEPDAWQVLTDRCLVEQLLLELSLAAHHRLSAESPFCVGVSNVEVIETTCSPIAGVAPGQYVKLLVGGNDGTASVESSNSPQILRLLAAIQRYAGPGGIERLPNSQIALYLPRASEVVKTSATNDTTRCAKTDVSEAATVLLVDDEEAARNATQRILKGEGYHVIEASSVKQALDISLQHSGEIDLLLTDVMLPDGDGGALFVQLRKMRSRLRVLFITGCGRDVLERYQLPVHECRILEKPCRRAKIVQSVSEALS